MTQTQLIPQINGLNIRQDVEGRFCLNDLHAAAGGESRYQPAHFFELDRTQEMLALLDKESLLPESRKVKPVVSKCGRYGGTYVSKTIVYAYASWLSPTFQVAVFKELGRLEGSMQTIINALEQFEVPEDLPGMQVYAIRNTDTGELKIGISKNPQARLKQLQTGSSAILELVATKAAPNRFQDEKEQHKINSKYWIHGEWFAKEAALSL